MTTKNSEVLEIDTEDIGTDETANQLKVITIKNDSAINLKITDTELQAWQEELSGIVIADIKDNKNYKAVDAIRKKVRKKRFEIDNYTEGVKALLNGFKKKLMTENLRVGDILLAMETEALLKTGVIDKEKERIKEEEKKRQLELLNTRKETLLQYEYPINEELLVKMTQVEFESLVASAKMIFDSNKIYLQTLEKTKKAAADKLQKEIDDLKTEKEQLEKQNADLQPAPIIAEPEAINNAETFPWDHTPQQPAQEIPLFDETKEETVHANVTQQPTAETIAAGENYKIKVLLASIESIVIPEVSLPENIILIQSVEICLNEIKELLIEAKD